MWFRKKSQVLPMPQLHQVRSISVDVSVLDSIAPSLVTRRGSSVGRLSDYKFPQSLRSPAKALQFQFRTLCSLDVL